MNVERAATLAQELLKLGVSQVVSMELLSGYSHDVIERQLLFLPYRSPKRPSALIVDAIRNNYSPPNEFYHAQVKAKPARTRDALDQGSQLPPRPPAPDPQGHGASSSIDLAEIDDRLEPGGPGRDLVLPELDVPLRPQE